MLLHLHVTQVTYVGYYNGSRFSIDQKACGNLTETCGFASRKPSRIVHTAMLSRMPFFSASTAFASRRRTYIGTYIQTVAKHFIAGVSEGGGYPIQVFLGTISRLSCLITPRAAIIPNHGVGYDAQISAHVLSRGTSWEGGVRDQMRFIGCKCF